MKHPWRILPRFLNEFSSLEKVPGSAEQKRPTPLYAAQISGNEMSKVSPYEAHSRLLLSMTWLLLLLWLKYDRLIAGDWEQIRLKWRTSLQFVGDASSDASGWPFLVYLFVSSSGSG